MKRSLEIIAFLLLSLALNAQVDFRAKLSQKEVQVGQRFQVEFSVNQDGRNFRAPSFQGFQVLSGPNFSVNTFRDNSGTRYKISYTYILQTRKEGEYAIDPAFIQIEGKTYRTEPVTVQVVKQKSKPQSRNRELIFLQAAVSDKSIYQGEPLFANYTLYYRTDVGQYQITSEPNYQDFYKEDVKLDEYNGKTEILDGQRYKVGDIRRLVLIPQKAGSYDLGSLDLKIPIRYATGTRDRFGFMRYATRTAELSADFPKLKVKPLPTKGRPQNFSGAVGQYKMDVDLSSTEINVDGSLSLKIRIEGKGNIKLCDLPEVEFPKVFEVFDPEIKEKSSVGRYGMQGFKEIEYLLVPRYGGSYKMEPIEFSYFDPKKGKYLRLQSEAFEITVKGGSGPANSSQSKSRLGSDNGESVDFINEDILFIKTKTKSWLKHDHQFLGSRLFWILILAPLIIALTLIGWWLRVKSELKNRDNLRVQRAGKAAKKNLQKAKKALSLGEAELFYQELETALYGFFSAKFNVGKSLLNKEFLSQALHKSEAPEEKIQEVIQLLEKCEMARFTGLKIDAAQQDYEHAMELLTEIDKHLWWGILF